MKKYETFPGEQPEIPVRPELPEIEQPRDPNESEILPEAPQKIPDEFPPVEKPTGDEE